MATATKKCENSGLGDSENACFQGEGGGEPEALLQAASRLFRQKGIDGVGVAEIAKEAGLTHGALYAHFSSKGELAAAAFSCGFAGNMNDTREWVGGRSLGFTDYLDGYLSPYMRDKVETGCPMAASASEIGRQDSAVGESFKRAFEEMATMLEDSLEDTIPQTQKRRARHRCGRGRDRRHRGISCGR